MRNSNRGVGCILTNPDGSKDELEALVVRRLLGENLSLEEIERTMAEADLLKHDSFDNVQIIINSDEAAKSPGSAGKSNGINTRFAKSNGMNTFYRFVNSDLNPKKRRIELSNSDFYHSINPLELSGLRITDELSVVLQKLLNTFCF